jgi:hypothetical protein
MTTVSMPLAALHLADGPAMYFGGTIMTFALPMGAFIVATIALFYLFRAQHSGPKLRYLAGAAFSSFGTREPGPVPAPPVRPETAAPQETATQATAPEETAPEETAPQATAPQATAPQEATTDPGTAEATEESEE